MVDHVTTAIGNGSSKIELIATDVGYHRLWAGRPCDVSLVLKLWLTAFVGTPVEDAVRDLERRAWCTPPLHGSTLFGRVCFTPTMASWFLSRTRRILVVLMSLILIRIQSLYGSTITICWRHLSPPEKAVAAAILLQLYGCVHGLPASSARQEDEYSTSCCKSSCSILFSDIIPSLRLPSAGRLQILLPVFSDFLLVEIRSTETA